MRPTSCTTRPCLCATSTTLLPPPAPPPVGPGLPPSPPARGAPPLLLLLLQVIVQQGGQPSRTPATGGTLPSYQPARPPRRVDNSGLHYDTVAQCRADCQALGGQLASVHSKEENDLVFSLIREMSPAGPSYWDQATWIGGCYLLPIIIFYHLQPLAFLVYSIVFPRIFLFVFLGFPFVFPRNFLYRFLDYPFIFPRILKLSLLENY